MLLLLCTASHRVASAFRLLLRRRRAQALLPPQVSVFDTIYPDQQYTKRVRRLGEFHPELAASKQPDGQDIEDPLYGNVGGDHEKVGLTVNLNA